VWARRDRWLDERIAAIEAGARRPFEGRVETAEEKFKQEEKRAAGLAAELVPLSLEEAKQLLDELEGDPDAPSPDSILGAVVDGESARAWNRNEALKEELERRRERFLEQKRRQDDEDVKESRARFVAQFAGLNEAELRTAVGAYLAGAEQRANDIGELESLASRLGVNRGQADRWRQRTDARLAAVVDLDDQIRQHRISVAAGDEHGQLSWGTERDIRWLLGLYVKSVKAADKRDRRNAVFPLVAFVAVGSAAFLAGDDEEFRRSDLFGSLAQVIPVLLLALAVEVRFLAGRGLARWLTGVTVVLVSVGLVTCLYVLFMDDPRRLAAAISVAAVAAGLTGLITAALSSPQDPRELFRTAGPS
jgi:hypothetical protein